MSDSHLLNTRQNLPRERFSLGIESGLRHFLKSVPPPRLVQRALWSDHAPGTMPVKKS
ncbi:MAG TPA: hypothetical protein DEB17_04320 [Chlorobaculum sp.]|uniref:Uncharacterized protein n=1 Tax=Chlorobaculum tepidum (strain ATCC 49652 / DSM 12025 / NBRC 103806 / TLS) TaxID=194439 RepID=Q8KAG7_CHLTE|nr:hypothetical protein CT2195 [Chlorobaculum tepidum TLS]HBU23209.1 hypothetical protein [Chlorobaculum sp.]